MERRRRPGCRHGTAMHAARVRRGAAACLPALAIFEADAPVTSRSHATQTGTCSNPPAAAAGAWPGSSVRRPPDTRIAKTTASAVLAPGRRRARPAPGDSGPLAMQASIPTVPAGTGLPPQEANIYKGVMPPAREHELHRSALPSRSLATSLEPPLYPLRSCLAVPADLRDDRDRLRSRPGHWRRVTGGPGAAARGSLHRAHARTALASIRAKKLCNCAMVGRNQFRQIAANCCMLG